MRPRITLPNDSILSTPTKSIENLAKTVFNHTALNNKFYDIWRDSLLSPQQYHIFATNYFHRVYATPTRLSNALSVVKDWESRIEILHNISDELGNGHKENVHVLVLFRWLDSLNEALGSKISMRDVIDSHGLLSETSTFIDETNELCALSPQSAAGAILAQEWHGYTQIAYLLDGFNNYKHLYRGTEFHDIAEYFYVHLGRAEKEHKAQSLIIASRHCTNATDFDKIQVSFNRYLDLLSLYWAALGEAIQFDGSSNPSHSHAAENVCN